MKEAPYRIDPDREDYDGTGIYVRAVAGDGTWHSTDIATLDRDSVSRWLRSRGGMNVFAESVVLALLGHREPSVPVVHPGGPM